MDRRRGILCALVSAALFGAATPVSKPLLDEFSPLLLAGLLYLSAALVLAPKVTRRARRGEPILPRDKANRKRLASAVLFGGVLGPVLLLAGLEQAKAASVAMWLNLETVATAVLGVLFFKEQLGKWTWVANVGVFVAGLLLAWEGGDAGWIGGLLVAGAAVCWGIDNNVTALVDGVTPIETTFWKGLGAGTTNVTLGLVLTDVPALGPSWAIALAIGAISYGVSIVLYIVAAQIIGAVRSQMLFATSPLFGVVGAALFLGEGLGVFQWIAGGVLIAANTLLFLDRHSHQHVHEPIEHEHEHTHDDGHHDHVHPGLPASTRHTHPHKHAHKVHTHPHWPDLHHRHRH